MAYSSDDFRQCRYNPLIKDFSKKYEDLFAIIPFNYIGDKEKLLRYICLMYDSRSPLVSDIASIETRKRTAAQYAGYKLDEGSLESIFDLTDKVIIDVIDVFLKEHINERLAYMIFANEQTFYEYGKRLLQPVVADKGEKDLLSAIAIKTKLSEDMAAINTRLENDYRRLYMNDNQLEKAATKKKFTPEAFANK